MDSTIARVGSVELTELKAELTNLSNTLHQIYDLMQADMRQVNVAWQDGKYQEFVDNYQPQIQKCEEVANRYAEWCTRVLDPTIENVIAVEETDVSGTDRGFTSVSGIVSGIAGGIIGGMASATVAGAVGKMFNGFNMGVDKPTDANSESFIPQKVRKVKAIEKNNKELEKAFGKPQGEPMSVEEADKQSANPHLVSKYIEDPNGLHEGPDGIRYSRNPDFDDAQYGQYKVNCATVAPTYVMRRRGFDVKAKGNPGKDGNLNTWLSKGHSFDIWNNADGTKAKPSLYKDYMKKKGLDKMSPNDYKNFFKDNCKDNGVYIVTVGWKGGGGHATIIQKDDKGLHYIEPQVYDSTRTKDGRRSLDDLVNRMSPNQSDKRGVMRVDDKVFNVNYVDIFEK